VGNILGSAVAMDTIKVPTLEIEFDAADLSAILISFIIGAVERVW